MMNRQINSKQVYNYIKFKYQLIYDHANTVRLPTNNLKIHLRGELKETLELGDTLNIHFESHIHDVPIIIDNSIVEEKIDGEYQSDFYIYDPDWPEIK